MCGPVGGWEEAQGVPVNPLNPPTLEPRPARLPQGVELHGDEHHLAHREDEDQQQGDAVRPKVATSRKVILLQGPTLFHWGRSV